ncbi:MAG: hypothetical protein ACT4PT_09870 [Methanobacteriota archaeon]
MTLEVEFWEDHACRGAVCDLCRGQTAILHQAALDGVALSIPPGQAAPVMRVRRVGPSEAEALRTEGHRFPILVVDGVPLVEGSALSVGEVNASLLALSRRRNLSKRELRKLARDARRTHL